jgi:ell wall binding domain 2 (CWB2)
VTRAGLLLLIVLLALAGCGGNDRSGRSTPTSTPSGPALGRGGGDAGDAGSSEKPAPTPAPLEVTKNTTRVGGADAIADAAGVAQAVFPARTPEERPQAVVLVDVRQPLSAISAALLMARPLQAPVLFSSGSQLPAVTRQALDALAPTGARKAGGAQVIRVGGAPAPPGLRSTQIRGASPAAVAAAVARFGSRVVGRDATAVVVAPSARPELAMPAAGWAAKSGDPVLLAGRDDLPPETVAELKALRRPKIYVLGPPEAISDTVLKSLRRLGAAKRIGTGDPVTNAIFFARYADGTFGWNVVDPGHGVVFADTGRVADAAAAAPLSASGTYGPLLLLPQAGELPQPLQDYLLDIQPGYDRDPVRGVYNHGWLVGDDSAISADVQSRLDALLEIQPVSTGGE